MATLPDARRYEPATLSIRGEEPLLIGLVGPPGGGKTVSALRLATGMRQVRPGPVVLIDTEGGRSKKYSPPEGQPADPSRLMFDFLRVDMTPPFRPHDFLAAIKAQLSLKPAAIIVDALSDEHEGEGGFLEWHDEMVPKMGGNEWAAWAVPKAARKRLISGLLQIKVPLLFTFRAREKTVTEPGKGKGGRDKITNIGWMPVAPLEIVHTLDLTCILPPKADGVPVWSSDKIGEDFIVKLPAFLKPLIQDGQLSEATGAALARWAKGGEAEVIPEPDRAPQAQPGPKTEAPAGTGPLLLRLNELLTEHLGRDADARAAAVVDAFGADRRVVSKMPADQLEIGLATLQKNLEGLAALRAEAQREREPGEN